MFFWIRFFFLSLHSFGTANRSFSTLIISSPLEKREILQLTHSPSVQCFIQVFFQYNTTHSMRWFIELAFYRLLTIRSVSEIQFKFCFLFALLICVVAIAQMIIILCHFICKSNQSNVSITVLLTIIYTTLIPHFILWSNAVQHFAEIILIKWNCSINALSP